MTEPVTLDPFDLNALDRLIEACWAGAESKGFHQPRVQPGETEPRKVSITERLMLIVSEIAEAMEEVRAGRSMLWWDQDAQGNQKPEGVAVELADALIRILDLCYEHNVPLTSALVAKHHYNAKRPQMHGDKKF